MTVIVLVLKMITSMLLGVAFGYLLAKFFNKK